MIDTWAGQSEFNYETNGSGGFIIIYGTNRNRIELTQNQLLRLRRHFSGLAVNVSSSRTEQEPNSLEEWLQQNVSRTSISSYVAAILVNEGMASRTPNNEIKFNTFA